MAKLLTVANWKMNPSTPEEAKKLFEGTKKGFKLNGETEAVVCPPFIYLAGFKNRLSDLKLGAQNIFFEEKGAYTGEISALMLKNLGCEYVILGHSERRKYFSETDEMINKKLKAVLMADLKPILCIGETAEQRKDGETNQIIENQLIKDLEGIKNLKFKTLRQAQGGEHSRAIKNLAIAYEPVWAIGTGNPCKVEDAHRALVFIRKALAKIYNGKIANNVRIIYGGSVNSQNAADYIKKAGFKGLLVGGASLDAKEFIKIIRACRA